MPEREERFVVNAPPEALWNFIRDVESLCSCIPGIERLHVVDDSTVKLTVKEKVGVIPLIVDFTAKIESERPPHNIRAVARADYVTVEVDVALQSNGGSSTELAALLKVKGEGHLKPIVDRLFETRVTERAAQFAETLEKRFGADPSVIREPTQVPGGIFRQWLARLWRRFTSSFRN